MRLQNVSGPGAAQTAPDLADWIGADMQDRTYICPCRKCPRCGWVDDDAEKAHPEDGLANCHSGNHGPGIFAGPEWWSHLGPFGQGRHITSDTEREEWKAHDELVFYGVRTGRGLEVARG